MLEYLPSFEQGCLLRLRLNAINAARVCGITPRQLKYWTGKGFVPTIDNSEHCYDIRSMKKAILIKRAVSEGHTLEMASKMVDSVLAQEAAEQQNLDRLDEDYLRRELTSYLEQLEGRLGNLRDQLPTYLTLFKFGETALLSDAKAVERFFRDNPYSFDTASSIARRVGQAIEEVQKQLGDLTKAGVLTRIEGDSPIYQLRRKADDVS